MIMAVIIARVCPFEVIYSIKFTLFRSLLQKDTFNSDYYDTPYVDKHTTTCQTSPYNIL